MSLTPEQVKAIQVVLVKQGFQHGFVSDDWTAVACEGYKQYLINQGVSYPNCTLLPESFAVLSQELKDAITGAAGAEPVIEVVLEEVVVAVTEVEPVSDVVTEVEPEVKVEETKQVEVAQPKIVSSTETIRIPKKST